jgi:hypothetical protein
VGARDRACGDGDAPGSEAAGVAAPSKASLSRVPGCRAAAWWRRRPAPCIHARSSRRAWEPDRLGAHGADVRWVLPWRARTGGMVGWRCMDGERARARAVSGLHMWGGSRDGHASRRRRRRKGWVNGENRRPIGRSLWLASVGAASSRGYVRRGTQTGRQTVRVGVRARASESGRAESRPVGWLHRHRICMGRTTGPMDDGSMRAVGPASFSVRVLPVCH